MPSYETLCAEFQAHPAYQALPTDVGQEVIKKARAAWNAYFANLRRYREGKLDHPPRPPGYWKDRKTGRRVPRMIPLKSPRSYTLDARALALTLPADLRQGKGNRLILPTRGLLRYTGALKTLELTYDRVTDRWYAHQVVEMPEAGRKARLPKWAGIDQNARIPAAVALEGDPVVRLYRAREIWREFLYWTRQIAEEQARLQTFGLKTSRRLRALFRTRRLRLRHALLALARQIACDFKQDRVTHVALEDLTGIRDLMDFGPKNLLVHNFWPSGRGRGSWRRP